MSNFSRVMQLALRLRWNVAACLVSSLVIAVLWAGNLSAVFWVVDVVMEGKSLPMYIDEQIADAQLDLMAIETKIAGLSVVANDSVAADTKLRQAQHEQSVQADRLARYQWFKPMADRWLPTTAFATLVYVCVVVFVSTLIKNILRIVNQVLVSRIGCRVSYELRDMFYRHMLRLDMADFNHNGRGDLMNRCTSDINAVDVGVQTVFGVTVREPLKMIACFVGAAWVSWRLLLLTIIVAPAAYLVIRWLAKALKRANRRAMEELSIIYDKLNETLSSIKLIKAFTMEAVEHEHFERCAKTYYRRQMRIAWYNSLVSPLTENLGMAMVLMAAVAGGFLVLSGKTELFGLPISDQPLTHGSMSMFFGMLVGMSDPARRLSNVFSFLQQSSAAADRVFQVLDRKPSIVDTPNPVPLPRLAQSLRFENVSFEYDPDKRVLEHIDLDVAAGETIAIVGPNGCGKSTLLSLLSRFYDPTSGRITIDGVDIRDVALHDLRSRIGIVSQEVLMMNDTVAANIAYGVPDADDDAIEAAARSAYAHGFITEKLADGYDTVVGPSGNRLSGGQRQRIALARAILADPEILILDEATSQVDVESEHLIHQVLEEFAQQRTTLLITHRMSTIALADRVVVMDKGKILDAGTHELLITRCEVYSRLFNLTWRESA